MCSKFLILLTLSGLFTFEDYWEVDIRPLLCQKWLKTAQNGLFYYYIAYSNLGIWIWDPYRVKMTVARNLCLQFTITWRIGFWEKKKVVAMLKLRFHV